MSGWPDISIYQSAHNCWAFQSEHMEACSPSENHKAVHHCFWENHYFFINANTHTITCTNRVSIRHQNAYSTTKASQNILTRTILCLTPFQRKKGQDLFVHWNVLYYLSSSTLLQWDCLIFCYYFQNIHKEFYQERSNDGLIFTLIKCLYQCHK